MKIVFMKKPKIKKFCQCGGIVKDNHSKSKFCSRRCAAVFSVSDLAKSRAFIGCLLYASGVGLKTASRLSNSSRKVIRRRLLLAGFKIRSELAAIPWNLGKKGAQSSKVNIEHWIAREYEREISIMKKTDENRHWGKHIDLIRFLSAKAARRKHQIARNEMRPSYIAKRLRNRIYCVLKGLKKSAPTIQLLGCSIKSLREVLEFQFQEGMSWQNHGTYWEIDHRRPCASFDLSKPEEQRACFHWSNLQPLTVTENRRKSDSWQNQTTN